MISLRVHARNHHRDPTQALAAGIQHGRSEGRAIHVTERIMMTSASNPLFGRVMAHNREVVRLGPLGMQEASAAPCVRLALPVIIAECENNVGRAENAPANALIINMS